MGSIYLVYHRLQETGETDVIDAGRIPRTLEIHLFGDLVDGVTPGDLVTITGIVKVVFHHVFHIDNNSTKTGLFPEYLQIQFISFIYSSQQYSIQQSILFFIPLFVGRCR